MIKVFGHPSGIYPKKGHPRRKGVDGDPDI